MVDFLLKIFHLLDPFSQLSFRSVSCTIETKKEQVRRILQLPPSQEPRVKEIEVALTTYLRRATETFDLSKNVEV